MLNLNLNSLSSNRGPAGPAPIPVPVVDFSASTTGPTAGDSVSFTDLSTNSPTAWEWEFPGGTPTGSTGQNPSITYSATGSYNVTLYAGNTGGTGSLTKTNFINVTAAPTPPVEQLFTANGTWSCCAGAVCVEVIAVGGGAAGRFTPYLQAGCSSGFWKQFGGPGGGAGEVKVCTLTSGFGSSQCVIIGSGGTSTTSCSNPGGNTCFGALVVSSGGAIGAASTQNSNVFTLETIAGGDGGGASSNGGSAKGGGCTLTSGQQEFVSCNAGNSGQAVCGFPGGGGAGGTLSARTDGAPWTARGAGGAGGSGQTLCGICLGAGGAGGISGSQGGAGNPGTNATCYGGGGGGAGAPLQVNAPTAGGNGFQGVLKVIQYFS